MKRKKLLCLPTLLLCLLCSCSEQKKTSLPVHSVEVTSPTPSCKTITKSYSGIVREAHEISLGFKTAGQIKRIHVEEGKYVKKGELLAELDDEDYKLGVEALQIQYDQLKDEVARTRKLFEQKSVSANDYEKASAGLKQLGVQLQVNKNKLEYTRLYAPKDGYIQSVNFSPAEMVDAGTAMFTFLDVSHLEVKTDLPSSIYKVINNVTSYDCMVSSEKESQTYPMDFLSLSPKADGNQLYQLILKFREKPERQITPGMNIEVRLTINEGNNSKDGFKIPACSIFKSSDNSCVWVLKEDSTIEKRIITIDNNFSGEQVAVTKGLDGTEKIVRAGVNSLQEGEKVTVIEQPEKSNVGGLI